MRLITLTALSLVFFIFLDQKATASARDHAVKGFTITEIGFHTYDASVDSSFKTEAQTVADRLYDVGVRHIVLSPRAVMHHPRQSYVELITPEHALQRERDAYLRFIHYLHGKGMTVGIRPLLFVVDPWGQTPYIEILPGGGEKVWWHGNIQPNDPAAWFRSFQYYLDIYLETARQGNVEEFTLGAELASLTVGAGRDWSNYPNGFAHSWNQLLIHARSILAKGTRVMYDVNFTDQEVMVGSGFKPGGELAQWRQRLVHAPLTSEAIDPLRTFYQELDSLGVDMYRSLALPDSEIPESYEELLALLSLRTNQIVTDLHETVSDIDAALHSKTKFILKEVGFKSVDRGFIDPFLYTGSGTHNLMHQAAAYEAVLRSFQSFDLPWFGGFVFWDASVDLNLHGPFDTGFSPLGKRETERVLTQYLQ